VRNTDLQSAFFPVRLEPLFFWETREKDPDESFPCQARGFQAVVDEERGYAVGVVGPDYHLVTNEEAVGLARKLFSELIPSVDPKDLTTFSIWMPSTRSFCRIDLMLPHHEVSVSNLDVYLPFIRITNSYNRSRALRFTLGFVRKACSNGVIFEEEAVRYSFDHTEEGIRRLDFSPSGSVRMEHLEEKFKRYVSNLQRRHVPGEYQLPLMAKVLELRFALKHPNEGRRVRERARLGEFREAATRRLSRYSSELGDNAYAVFNALTDYTTNPESDDLSVVQIVAMQKRVGRWAAIYPTLAEEPGFSLDEYTAETGDYFN